MSRLTLRLPESLHRQLEQLADSEAVSLNQYIVYALTQQVTLAYTVQSVPEKMVAEQRAAYTALLQNLGQSSFEQVRAVLDERENAEAEPGLSADVVERLKKKINESKP